MFLVCKPVVVLCFYRRALCTHTLLVGKCRISINQDRLSGLGRYFLLYIELIFFGFLSDIAAMSRQGGQKDADRKQRDGRKHDAQDR